MDNKILEGIILQLGQLNEKVDALSERLEEVLVELEEERRRAEAGWDYEDE